MRHMSRLDTTDLPAAALPPPRTAADLERPRDPRTAGGIA